MRHYIRAGDVAGLAAALAEAAQRGDPAEEDLFLVRAVLCTAAAPTSSSGGGGGAAQVEAARALLQGYAAAAGHEPPATPLLRFAGLLLEALAARKADLVDLLLQR